MSKGVLTIGLTALLSLPLISGASVLTGVLNTTGTATLSSGGISFLNNELFINGPAGAQEGDFTSLAGSTGSIQNISPATPGSVNVPNFVTFALDPNISITLAFIMPGFDGSAGCTVTPSAAGQICTPSGSPLNLQNTSGSSSTGSFDVQGTEYDSLTGDSVAVTGVFTLPFSHQNYQQILATLAAGGSDTTSFAGQFSTDGPIIPGSPVPEPSTLIALILAFGTMGIARFRTTRE
jgi:hypothetical protein